jgi:DNA-binding PadR family transcriptional regulator
MVILLQALLEEHKAPLEERQALTVVQIHAKTALGVGTILTLLDRLAEYGWVESRREEENERAERATGSPRRRYYSLSFGGAATARTAITVRHRPRLVRQAFPVQVPLFS